MSNIGIMDPAFFVGKNVLLKWLNDFFDAGYTKVEQTCTGSMHCQILDAIYPGKVPLGKVNFDAKNEYEFVNNFKVLQSVFDSQQITKYIDVQRIIKGKFQDNLEMLQWMKHFFDTNYGGQPYDAKGRRTEAMQQYKKMHKHAATGSAASTGAVKKPAAAAAAPAEPSPAKPTPAAAPKPAVRAAVKPAVKPAATKPSTSSSSSSSSKSLHDQSTAELTSQLSKLSVTIEGLEKERNFYFGKLREIEILCQEDENADKDTPVTAIEEVKKQILAILYATDDNSEFTAPEQQTTEQTQQQEEASNGEEGLLGSDDIQQQ